MAPEIITDVALAFVGGLLGSISVWYTLRHRVILARNEGRAEGNAETARADERASLLGTELDRERAGSQQKDDRLKDIHNKLNAATEEAAGLREKASRVEALETQVALIQRAKESLASEVTKLNVTLDEERKHSAEKLALLDQAKEKLSDAFRSLANDILEDKSARFTEQNKTNISRILEPLNSKIQDFKEKVEQVYRNDSNDRVALKTQVTQLMSVTIRVSDDAKSLADALKGLSKIQGNLGEIVRKDFGKIRAPERRGV